VQWAAFAILLVGYWAAWALYPAAGPDFDYAWVKVPPDWPHHAAGLAAHWNKNSNLGSGFDVWFLNLFPRSAPFVANGGGYLTLSFIPTLGTMLLGLAAGNWLRGELTSKQKLQRLALAGVAGLSLGLALHALGLCPLVKRIWTPTWTLFSGGCCFLLLAGFYFVLDVRGRQAWAFPLMVIGMNSIAAYVLAHLAEDFIKGSFRTHLGPEFFARLGGDFAPLWQGAAVLLVLWLVLYWMYQRRLFLRI
jgi:predicted acyltransferase